MIENEDYREFLDWIKEENEWDDVYDNNYFTFFVEFDHFNQEYEKYQNFYFKMALVAAILSLFGSLVAFFLLSGNKRVIRKTPSFLE